MDFMSFVGQREAKLRSHYAAAAKSGVAYDPYFHIVFEFSFTKVRRMEQIELRAFAGMKKGFNKKC
jgi:hypothetical protein